MCRACMCLKKKTKNPNLLKCGLFLQVTQTSKCNWQLCIMILFCVVSGMNNTEKVINCTEFFELPGSAGPSLTTRAQIVTYVNKPGFAKTCCDFIDICRILWRCLTSPLPPPSNQQVKCRC